MPFHTSGNNVVYSSPTWTQQFIESDIVEIGDAIASGTIAPWSVSLGKYERMVGKIVLFYNSDASNELFFRMRNIDKNGAAVATSIKYGAVATIATVTEGASLASNRLHGGMAVATTNGTGTTIKIDSNSSDTPLSMVINFAALSTAGTHGTLEVQASNITAAAGESDILAGSYISYRRF